MVVSDQSCRSLVLEDRGDCPAFVFFNRPDDCQVGNKEIVNLQVLDASTLEKLASDKPLLQEIVDDYYLTIEKRPEIVTVGVAGIRMGSLYLTPMLKIQVKKCLSQMFIFP